MDQWWVSDKEFLNNADVGLIPGSGLWVRKIPWIRKWQPTPVFLSEDSQRQRTQQATVHGIARVGHT